MSIPHFRAKFTVRTNSAGSAVHPGIVRVWCVVCACLVCGLCVFGLWFVRESGMDILKSRMNMNATARVERRKKKNPRKMSDKVCFKERENECFFVLFREPCGK